MSYRRRYSRSYGSYAPNRSNNTLAAHRAYYRGIEFKSKLEVRWAYLFDTLGIPWRYEPQKFYACGGGNYVPDFALPTLGVWWEAKGAPPNDAAWRAAHSLMEQTRVPVCVSWGAMAPGEGGRVYGFNPNGQGQYVGLAGCAICSQVAVVSLAIKQHEKHLFQFHHPDVVAAFEAAVNAPFEMGAGQ